MIVAKVNNRIVSIMLYYQDDTGVRSSQHRIKNNFGYVQ